MSHYEKDLSKEHIFTGRIFEVAKHQVSLEDDTLTTREVVYHNGGVCVVAVDNVDNLLMVKQYRFPTGQELYELPAGKLEKGENHLSAGLRELEEETGYNATSMDLLTCFYPTPAYCSEKIYIYKANDIYPTCQHLDVGEFLSVEKIPFDKALQMVFSGEIVDGKTQIGILMYAQQNKR